MRWVFLLIVVVSLWRIFQKAGRAPWKALIPAYDTIVLFEIAERPAWHGIVTLSFSCLGVVAGRVLLPNVALAMLVSWTLIAAGTGFWIGCCISLAARFDRGPGFGIGLAMLPVVFMPVLAFGDASYRAESASSPEVLGLN